jgi:hypothetical protein
MGKRRCITRSIHGGSQPREEDLEGEEKELVAWPIRAVVTSRRRPEKGATILEEMRSGKVRE